MRLLTFRESENNRQAAADNLQAAKDNLQTARKATYASIISAILAAITFFYGLKDLFIETAGEKYLKQTVSRLDTLNKTELQIASSFDSGILKARAVYDTSNTSKNKVYRVNKVVSPQDKLNDSTQNKNTSSQHK